MCWHQKSPFQRRGRVTSHRGMSNADLNHSFKVSENFAGFKNLWRKCGSKRVFFPTEAFHKGNTDSIDLRIDAIISSNIFLRSLATYFFCGKLLTSAWMTQFFRSRKQIAYSSNRGFFSADTELLLQLNLRFVFLLNFLHDTFFRVQQTRNSERKKEVKGGPHFLPLRDACLFIYQAVMRFSFMSFFSCNETGKRDATSISDYFRGSKWGCHHKRD